MDARKKIICLLPLLLLIGFSNTSMARYIEPDPLGLAGGINPYTYVSNNPVMLVDPLGLLEGSPANLARREAIVNVATSYIGSHKFDFAANVSAQYPAKSWKCSGFVCDVLDQVQIPMRVTPQNNAARCPTAGELANLRWNPQDWRLLDSSENPQAGDIAAFPIDPHPEDPNTYTGHTGIVGDSGVIAAHAYGVSNTPQLTANPIHPIIYRRYTGE